MALDAPLFWLAPLLDRRGAARVSSKLYRLAELLQQSSIEELYRTIASYHWPGHRLDASAATAFSAEPASWAQLPDPRERMMCQDLVTYLPDDILVKVDRAGMAVSLETRMPLLDHRLIEFALQLPLDYKLRGGRSKAVLRDVLARHVPPALTERPKMGFGVPLGRWLCGPLRDWAEALLAPAALADGGLLDAALVRRMWQEHVGRQREWQSQLWAVLMFQAWRQQRPAAASARAA